jgi:pimeloyl-ACP methyl ester carboxylesterase
LSQVKSGRPPDRRVDARERVTTGGALAASPVVTRSPTVLRERTIGRSGVNERATLGLRRRCCVVRDAVPHAACRLTSRKARRAARRQDAGSFDVKPHGVRMNTDIHRRPMMRLALVAATCVAAVCAVPGAHGQADPPAARADAPTPPASWTIPPGIRSVRVDGYPVAYVDEGAGEPVVLIHGAFVDHRLWRQQIDALARSYRVIAPSLHHHWPEPWDGRGEPFSVRRNVADIAGLVRSLDLGKVHLVGHSMGGMVAVELARSNPDMLRTLTLADPAGPVSLLGDEVAQQRREAGAKFAQMVRTRLDTGDRRVATQSMWDAISGPGAWDRASPTVQQMMVDNVGTAAAPPDPAPPGLECAEVRAWPFPVLLVHGESSAATYREIGGALRRCRADIAEPVTVPKAGHNMHVQNPEAFNEALRSFLSRR